MKNLDKIYFPGKEPDEKIVVALRRHVMAVIKREIFLVFIALLPIVIYLVLSATTNLLVDTTNIGFILIVLLASLFYLYILLFMYYVWLDYYLDIWLITNERIIGIEQKGLFNRTTAELRLDKIQDVASETKGSLATVFRYGTIHVQTASETQKFNFTEVPRPEEVARQILELHERYVGRDQPGQQPLAQPTAVDKKPDENQPV